MPTENSVVASLNEVRRLERERVRREQEHKAQQDRREADERARREAELAAWQDARRPHAAYDPSLAAPGANSNGWGAAGDATRRPHRTYEMPAYGEPGPSGRFDLPPEPARVEVRTRTSFAAVFVVALLLIGGGAFGYVHLQKDLHGRLMDAERARLAVEQQRNAALDAKDADARQARAAIAALEQKVASMEAEALRRAAELRTAQAGEAEATVAAKPAVKSRAGRARLADKKTRGARAANAVKAEAVAEPPKAKLKIRRPNSDDPLNGLKLF